MLTPKGRCFYTSCFSSALFFANPAIFFVFGLIVPAFEKYFQFFYFAFQTRVVYNLLFFMRKTVTNTLSAHTIHGVKTACAAVLAYAITTWLDLELGYWAVISTVIVMQVYVADSIEMCLTRFTGTAAGAVMGVIIILMAPEHPVFIGMSLFIAIGICSALTQYKPRYRMAAITVVIVVMTGITSENVVAFGLSRVYEIFIGILCAFLVSVLVLPRRGVDELTRRLYNQSTTVADTCHLLVDAFVSRQQNVDETLVDDLLKSVWENHALFQKISEHEARIYRSKFNTDFSCMVTLITRCTEHLRNMVRALNALDDEGYEIILANELKALARQSGDTLMRLMHREPATGVDDLERMIVLLDHRLSGIRQKGLIRRFDSKKLVQIFSFYSSLEYLAEDILWTSRKIQQGS